MKKYRTDPQTFSSTPQQIRGKESGRQNGRPAGFVLWPRRGQLTRPPVGTQPTCSGALRSLTPQAPHLPLYIGYFPLLGFFHTFAFLDDELFVFIILGQ